MTGLSVNPLAVPGVPALMFKALQAGSRYPGMLASLHAIETMFGLPAASWFADDVYGVGGTFHGCDEDVVAAVRARADGFEAKPVVKLAFKGAAGTGVKIVPGFAVAQILPGVTVGGRLMDPGAGQ